MNLLDLLIVVVLLLGLYLGFARGLIRPLIAELGGLFVLGVLVINPAGLDAFVPHSIPRPVAVILLLVFGGFVFSFVGRVVAGAAYRVPLVKSLDKLGGVVFNGVLAFLLLYLAISALITLDDVLQPINHLSQVGPAQVAQLEQNLANTPGAALFIDRNALQQLQKDSQFAQIPTSSLGQYDGWLQFYEQRVRPQLISSSLAPIVIKIGQKLPLIGHQQTYPKS